MKMLMLLMLSLFLLIPEATYAGYGGLEDNNESFSPSLFCEEIQKNILNNSPIEMTCGGFKNHIQETAITALCEEFVNEYKSDKTAMMQKCEELGVNLKTALDQVEKGEILDIKHIAHQINKRVNRGTLKDDEIYSSEVTSSAMKACQDQMRDNCGAEVLDVSFLLFAKSFPQGDYFAQVENGVDYNAKTCECFTKGRKVTANLFRSDIKKEDDEGKQKVLDLIEENIAKKLVNEFAANIERSHFYKANSNTSLSSLGADPKFSCSNAADFKADIQKACHGSGMDQKQIDQKISNFLDAFESKKTNAPLEDKFQYLQEKILNTGKSRLGTLMDRTKYDNYRYTNAVEGPEGIFIQELLRKVISNKDMYKSLTSSLEEKHPAWALSQLITEFSGKELNKFFSDFSRRKDIPDVFKKDINQALLSNSELNAFKASTFEIAIDMNPSLKAAFTDKDLFLEALSSLDNKNTLMDALEKSSDKMKKHYLERCAGLRHKFAEAICTPKERYLEKMNRDDMRKLLHANLERFPSATMIDKIMCDVTKENVDRSSAFGRVAFTKVDRFIESDYASRMKKGEDSQGYSDRYSYISKEMNSGNKSVEQLIQHSADRSSRLSSSSAPMLSSMGNKDSAEAKSLTPMTAQLPQEKMLPPPSPAFNSFAVQNSVERSPAGTQNDNKEKSKSSSSQENLHDLFKSFFAEESQKRKVDDHLKNISDSDYKELQSLKEQIARGKVELNELASQREKEKIKSLEEKVKRLETEKKNAESQSEVATRTRDNSEKFASGAPQFQAGGFIPAKENNAFPAIGNTGGSAGQTGAASTHAAGGPGNSAVRAIANEGKAQTDTGYTVREATGGDLIITSSKVHGSNLKTEDLSAEVIDFVKKQKPDLKTLKQLMSKGLILKLKVVKDGAEIQKEFKVDSQKLTEQAKNYLKSQIALQEYQEAKRQHSFASLKYLLGIKMQSTVN